VAWSSLWPCLGVSGNMQLEQPGQRALQGVLAQCSTGISTPPTLNISRLSSHLSSPIYACCITISLPLRFSTYTACQVISCQSVRIHSNATPIHRFLGLHAPTIKSSPPHIYLNSTRNIRNVWILKPHTPGRTILLSIQIAIADMSALACRFGCGMTYGKSDNQCWTGPDTATRKEIRTGLRVTGARTRRSRRRN
jgi:hypothetical protein